MTPLRQAFHAALLGAGLGLSSVAQAEPVAPMGPPTAAEAEAAVAAAPVVVASAPSVAPAAPPAWLAKRPAAPKPAATGKSALPSMGRTLGLLLVVGSLGGAALYLKRKNRNEGARATTPQRLMVVSSTRIGPKAHAVVISVAGRQMLLGVTDSSVKRLAFIDEVEDEDSERSREREPARRVASPSATRGAAIAVRTVTTTAPAASRAGSFADVLKTAFGRRTVTPEPATDAASILAAETQDSVGGKPVTGNAGNVRMIDVEGQAQGLLRRLSGPKA